jgi:hypothetical protein
MTLTSKTFSFAAAIATVVGAALIPGSAAVAGSSKDVYVQDYTFAKPMHGFSGHAAGGYYCDYQRLPNRKCSVDKSGNERCVIVSWTLREMCH